MRRALVLLLLLLPSRAPAAPPREDTVLLLHTNDLHGHIENAAALAAMAQRERTGRPDALWLDAGDAISGTPVSTVFQGTPIFSVTSLMGVDAGCLGNHEFDHGFARIAEFRKAATYPILCANVREPDGALLADEEWRLFDADGVKVGVIGLLTEKTPGMTVRKGNEGVKFEPARDALKRLLPEVRAKCDLVVALTHLGYDDDVELARTVPGVDVVVGGHSHTDLPGPVKIGDTLVVQAYRYGLRLGRLDLTVDLDSRRIVRWEGKPLVVDAAKEKGHPGVALAVADLEASVTKRVDVTIAKAERDLGKDDLRLLAERAYREAAKADLGFHNEGGVRLTIPKGPVTIRQLWNVFPFDNTIVKVKVPGARLPKEIARGADPERVYVVATNSFVADHLDKFLPGALPDVEDTGLDARNAIAEWVKGNPDLK